MTVSLYRTKPSFKEGLQKPIYLVCLMTLVSDFSISQGLGLPSHFHRAQAHFNYFLGPTCLVKEPQHESRRTTDAAWAAGGFVENDSNFLSLFEL